jgi:hypothetical protein
MSDVTNPEREEELVRALLAPLARAEPVLLGSTRPARRWRRRALLGAGVAASLAVVGGGMAAAGVFGPLHGVTLQPGAPDVPLSGTTACQLIGQTAAQADKTLTENGYRVEWRFMRWGDESLPAVPVSTTGPGTTDDETVTPAPAGAVVGGFSSAPTTVPGDSVVWQMFTDGHASRTVLVFVEAPNDPNAPTISPPDCSTTPSS